MTAKMTAATTIIVSDKMMTGILDIRISPRPSVQYTASRVAAKLWPAWSMIAYKMFRAQMNTIP